MNRKQYLKLVSEKIQNNLLRESTISGDVAAFNSLNMPLVKKIYPDMLTTQICDVQPLSAPRGIIAALFSYYKPTADVNLENGRIIELSDVVGLTVGQVVVVGATTWEIQYIDKTSVLAIATAGPNVPLVIGSLFAGKTVLATTINRAAIKKIFSQYSGLYTMPNDEVVPREVAHEIRTLPIETKTRKLVSTFTQEKLQDFQRIYGESGYDIAASNLGNEIIQETDMEFIDYIRTIATPMNDLILNASYGTQGDMMAIGNDIYANIFFAAEQIVKATKRNRTMFVLADAATVALLLTNPLHVSVSEDEDNPFYVGKLGTYKLYCDIYSEDHYVTVGYRGENMGDGDSGVIFSPYADYMISKTDPTTLKEKFFLMSRYAMTRHPQDQGTGIGDSDFFRSFSIDFAGLTNFTA